jgi:hypothetical protein
MSDNRRLEPVGVCEQMLQQLDEAEVKIEIEVTRICFPKPSGLLPFRLTHFQGGQSNLEVYSVVIPRRMNHCDDSH